jgi:hypothetical protein
MARSFDLVDEKLFEADFFLEKLDGSGFDLWEARFYLSAFIGAARSVTFALQGSISDLDGFNDWYSAKQDALRTNPTARFFAKARTDSQHLGINPLQGGRSGRSADGKLEYRFYFGSVVLGEPLPDCPTVDVVTACREYLTLLVQYVFDCYQQFGPSIDPSLFYTVENLERRGMSIEDVEESFGYPRGWTAVGGVLDADQRLRLLRREAGATSVDFLFEKYLGRSR